MKLEDYEKLRSEGHYEALAFHWENEQTKIEGRSIPYTENSFYSLIDGFHQEN